MEYFYNVYQRSDGSHYMAKAWSRVEADEYARHWPLKRVLLIRVRLK